jgi:hypothetical protein
MKNNKLALILGAILVIVCGGILITGQTKNAFQKQPETKATDYRLSGPYTHKNLSIFLIHSKTTTTRTRSFLTLQEALEQKKVIVYETQSVNELAIENVSSEDIYVQSGDIVKGGKQDRMMAQDFIVPPKSGRMPISAFCVEHGRWSGRGNERAGGCGSYAGNQAGGEELKLAGGGVGKRQTGAGQVEPKSGNASQLECLSLELATGG